MAPPDDPPPSAATPTSHPPAHRTDPSNSNNTPTTNNTSTIPNTQHTTTANAQQTNSTTPNPTSHTILASNGTQQPETLFDVPNFNIARSANSSTYRQHVRTLHAEMSGGDSSDYHESRIALPRSLQGLKTNQVITRIISQNPTLNTNNWAAVTADVIGANLVLGTVSTNGKELIDSMGELKVEPGRTVKVPPAAKPNNFYYVELLLPYERELHVDFMEALLLSFPSATHISMPGKKPFGTTRRLRLYFNSTTAPREVFTSNDHTIPIREIRLPSGTAAQLIHKWQRLNQYRPPHLVNRWHQQNPSRSYAAAASTNPTTHNPANNIPPTATSGAQPYSYPPPPWRRTGEVPNGPPHSVTIPPSSSTPTPATPHQPHDTPATDQDWMNDDPFPSNHPSTSQATPNQPNTITNNAQPTLSPTPHQPTTTPETPRHNTNPQPAPPPLSHPTNTPTSTAAPSGVPRQQTRQNPPPEYSQGPLPQSTADKNPQLQPALTTRPHNENSNQWQQVLRTRNRPSLPAPPPATSPALKRSSSRSKKQKPTNKFTALDFQILPAYEDDDVAPIEVSLAEHPLRPPRRKYRTTRKALPKLAAEAISHPQQIRHPANTLQHLSPRQAQIVLRSKDPTTAAGRSNLLKQIALIRAARTNTNSTNISLDPTTESAFLQQVQNRLADCPDCPHIDRSSDIDIPLSAILDQDETKVRGAICYAWIDLASRAILPHLYDAWPDPPKWNGSDLSWLTSTDGETPCLQDEALALLAACPTLQNVWTHIETSSPDLQAAVRTAATQWHMFSTTDSNNPSTSS